MTEEVDSTDSTIEENSELDDDASTVQTNSPTISAPVVDPNPTS